jgi:hypothetical protein
LSNNSSSKVDQFCLISLANAATKNELADWLVANKIIEHLYGPNLHVEVVKRSQEIVNFLAFTNRLNEKHLDCIWSSAQLKHCSKPVMDTLMSLHKHLNVDSIQYLSSLIAKLDLSQHNEQTLLLSALLTKNLWLLILDWEDEQANSNNNNNSNNTVNKINNSITGEKTLNNNNNERNLKMKIKKENNLCNNSKTVNANYNQISNNINKRKKTKKTKAESTYDPCSNISSSSEKSFDPCSNRSSSSESQQNNLKGKKKKSMHCTNLPLTTTYRFETF